MDLIEKGENINRHPWELSRSRNILKLLKNVDEDFIYADIGAGDKYFTSKLSLITKGDVFAIDREYKKTKSEEDGIICLNDVSLLNKSSIDCVIMMDVLEHIENENDFLYIVLEKLKPNGKIIITVPAMQYLFSSHDVFLKHFRRYNRKQLLCLLSINGIYVEQCYYFFSILFIMRCLSLLIEKIFKNKERKNIGVGRWEYSEKSLITRFLVFILNIDFLLNKLLNKIFFRLPGLSLLAICKFN
jgi:SAM-dependent methyltransferase